MLHRHFLVWVVWLYSCKHTLWRYCLHVSVGSHLITCSDWKLEMPGFFHHDSVYVAWNTDGGSLSNLANHHLVLLREYFTLAWWLRYSRIGSHSVSTHCVVSVIHYWSSKFHNDSQVKENKTLIEIHYDTGWHPSALRQCRSSCCLFTGSQVKNESFVVVLSLCA